MGALTLGPLVLSTDRAYAACGFLVLIVAAEVWARRGRPELVGWAWRVAIATLLGARVGFVVTNAGDYAAAPLSTLAFWQGGFAPWWGLVAGAATAWFEVHRHPSVRPAAPAIALAAVLAWWLPSGLLTAGPAASGVVVPDLTLSTLAGEPVALAGAGTPTVVNVWATWCPPCRRELPLFVAAAAATPDVRVLLVNQGEGAETVRRYLDVAGLPVDGVLLDGRHAVGSALRVAGLPTTFAFDATGRLVDMHVGEISAAALRGLLERTR